MIYILTGLADTEENWALSKNRSNGHSASLTRGRPHDTVYS